MAAKAAGGLERDGADSSPLALGSTNGCFVNRVRLIGSTRLEESDTVRPGSAELRLRRPVDSP
jgi:hypothetical protein